MLKLLHEGHPGITRMKALARGVVWWSGMDSELESKVNECEACQANRKSPPKAPLHPWEWPSKPWSHLHIDHAGPFLGEIFLIVVDAYSKWLEVVPAVSTSSQQTIREFRHLFATHGLPEIVVSDNGTAFSSTEFGCFMKHNGIRHIWCAPYHPSSNGSPERAVQTFKEAMKKTEGDLEIRINRFLSQYRSCHYRSTTSPRTLLDLLVPDITTQVHRSKRLHMTRELNHSHFW